VCDIKPVPENCTPKEKISFISFKNIDAKRITEERMA
jgi:hypothetical protein